MYIPEGMYSYMGNAMDKDGVAITIVTIDNICNLLVTHYPVMHLIYSSAV